MPRALIKAGTQALGAPSRLSTILANIRQKPKPILHNVHSVHLTYAAQNNHWGARKFVRNELVRLAYHNPHLKATVDPVKNLESAWLAVRFKNESEVKFPIHNRLSNSILNTLLKVAGTKRKMPTLEEAEAETIRLVERANAKFRFTMERERLARRTRLHVIRRARRLSLKDPAAGERMALAAGIEEHAFAFALRMQTKRRELMAAKKGVKLVKKEPVNAKATPPAKPAAPVKAAAKPAVKPASSAPSKTAAKPAVSASAKGTAKPAAAKPAASSKQSTPAKAASSKAAPAKAVTPTKTSTPAKKTATGKAATASKAASPKTSTPAKSAAKPSTPAKGPAKAKPTASSKTTLSMKGPTPAKTASPRKPTAKAPAPKPKLKQKGSPIPPPAVAAAAKSGAPARA